MTLQVPVSARFPWPGGTTFPAGVVIPLTTPAAFFPHPGRPPCGRSSVAVESAHALGYDSTAPGGVPEWLKGADCKSVGAAYLGSNPSSPTKPG